MVDRAKLLTELSPGFYCSGMLEGMVCPGPSYFSVEWNDILVDGTKAYRYSVDIIL